MTEDDSSNNSDDGSSKREIRGGVEKGFSDDGNEGSEGDYGFIRPSAESDTSDDSESDSE